jgi:hypothetical protein
MSDAAQRDTLAARIWRHPSAVLLVVQLLSVVLYPTWWLLMIRVMGSRRSGLALSIFLAASGLMACTAAPGTGRSAASAASSASSVEVAAPTLGTLTKLPATADDPREASCFIEPGKDFIARLEIAEGDAFWDAFPKAGGAPEMAEAQGPVFLVVYPDGFQGPLAQAPGTKPSGPRKPDPGTVDVCAVFADGSRLIYANIPREGSPILQ